MPQPSTSRFALSLIAASLLLPLSGCKFIAGSLAQQADKDPNTRQKVVDAANTGCLKSSHDAFPQIPNREAIIVNYCKCFSEKGMANFSTSELVEIGLRPDHKLTAEQNKKLDAAGDMCMTETRNKLAAPAQ